MAVSFGKVIERLDGHAAVLFKNAAKPAQETDTQDESRREQPRAAKQVLALNLSGTWQQLRHLHDERRSAIEDASVNQIQYRVDH